MKKYLFICFDQEVKMIGKSSNHILIEAEETKDRIPYMFNNLKHCQEFIKTHYPEFYSDNPEVMEIEHDDLLPDWRIIHGKI